MGEVASPRPLAAHDDTTGFAYGRDALNHWLRRHAWRNQQGDVSRSSVVCDPADGSIVGYVSLSAAQIERAWLPKAQQRNRPDAVPAVLLGQLAVDVRWQGRGVARSLMFFALHTAVRFSQEVGCYAVLTHPLDDGVRALYRSFGFEGSAFRPCTQRGGARSGPGAQRFRRVRHRHTLISPMSSPPDGFGGRRKSSLPAPASLDPACGAQSGSVRIGDARLAPTILVGPVG